MNSAVIVENAVPISTARPSRARAPAKLSASEATQAIAAAVTTSPKCSCAVSIAGRVPMATTTTIGTIAASSHDEREQP